MAHDVEGTEQPFVCIDHKIKVKNRIRYFLASPPNNWTYRLQNLQGHRSHDVEGTGQRFVVKVK